jgi:hypothetical protein
MESRRQLREELKIAIVNVRRQINVQQSTTGYGAGPYTVKGRDLALTELKAELAQLEEALAGLESHNA